MGRQLRIHELGAQDPTVTESMRMTMNMPNATTCADAKVRDPNDGTMMTSHEPVMTTTTATPWRSRARVAHGRRLVCFRPRQRFSIKSMANRPATSTVMCTCEHQVFQCHMATEMTDESDSATKRDMAMARLTRRKKWVERFEGHEWEKQERVCQKWRDNQHKFQLAKLSDTERGHSADVSPSRMSPTKAGIAMKNALSNFASAAEGLLLNNKFDGLLRAGVPSYLRGRVWWMCSGAAEKRDAASSVATYAALVKRIPQLGKRAAMEIEKDLPRTFPNDPPIDGEPDLRARNICELRRVLQAYSLRNPVVGYCQSMNFLGAVLLQYMEEEEAFWVLVAMVENLIPQYHTRSMLGSRAEQRVFTELVQQKLPDLYQHLRSLGVDLEPFTLKWFLCLFLNTLPLEPVMRIWDLFFCEGSHVLLRIGLTLLKLNQPRLLGCVDAIEVYEMFQFSHETLREMTAPYRVGLLNRDDCVCDTLVRLAMDKSFVGVIAFDTLHELRQLYRNDVAEELKEADERRSSRGTGQSCEGSVDDECQEMAELLSSERGGRRHTDAERELNEYDFVEEYSYHCDDISPTKHIHFRDLYDGVEAGEAFVDVDYDGTAPAYHQT